MIKFITSAVSQFLFPSRCPSCGAYTEHEGQWCSGCLRELLRADTLTYDASVREYISPVFAAARYDKGLRRLIHELKYDGRLSMLKYLPPLFEVLDATWQFDSFDAFIPVPLHEKKLKLRGFNQVEKIFLPWLLQHGFKYSDVLLRTKQTHSQYSLNRLERRQNLRSAFALKPGASVKGLHCLLLDDIFTSGSTMSGCAQVLLAGGAASVSGLVLASEADS